MKIELVREVRTQQVVPAGERSLCTFLVGEQMFAIATDCVREVLTKRTPERVPLAPAYIAGAISYRGEVLPAVSLRMLLGLPVHAEAGAMLVLDGDEDGDHCGLIVDRVGGVMTADAAIRTECPATLDESSRALFCGAYRLPQGLLVELDAASLKPIRLAKMGLVRM